jgi:hypothetical protein
VESLEDRALLSSGSGNIALAAVQAPVGERAPASFNPQGLGGRIADLVADGFRVPAPAGGVQGGRLPAIGLGGILPFGVQRASGPGYPLVPVLTLTSQEVGGVQHEPVPVLLPGRPPTSSLVATRSDQTGNAVITVAPPTSSLVATRSDQTGNTVITAQLPSTTWTTTPATPLNDPFTAVVTSVTILAQPVRGPQFLAVATALGSVPAPGSTPDGGASDGCRSDSEGVPPSSSRADIVRASPSQPARAPVVAPLGADPSVPHSAEAADESLLDGVGRAEPAEGADNDAPGVIALVRHVIPLVIASVVGLAWGSLVDDDPARTSERREDRERGVTNLSGTAPRTS